LPARGRERAANSVDNKSGRWTARAAAPLLDMEYQARRRVDEILEAIFHSSSTCRIKLDQRTALRDAAAIAFLCSSIGCSYVHYYRPHASSRHVFSIDAREFKQKWQERGSEELAERAAWVWLNAARVTVGGVAAHAVAASEAGENISLHEQKT